MFIFSTISPDRIVHFLWALLFCMISIVPLLIISKALEWKIGKDWFSKLRPPGANSTHFNIVAFSTLFFGSWLPDIDWVIHLHRAPFTHSVLPFIVVSQFLRFSKIGNSEWNRRLLVIFGYGLASHLVSDIIPGGNVVWLPAIIDMPFLFVNGIITFYLSFKIHKSISSNESNQNADEKKVA